MYNYEALFLWGFLGNPVRRFDSSLSPDTQLKMLTQLYSPRNQKQRQAAAAGRMGQTSVAIWEAGAFGCSPKEKKPKTLLSVCFPLHYQMMSSIVIPSHPLGSGLAQEWLRSGSEMAQGWLRGGMCVAQTAWCARVFGHGRQGSSRAGVAASRLRLCSESRLWPGPMSQPPHPLSPCLPCSQALSRGIFSML